MQSKKYLTFTFYFYLFFFLSNPCQLPESNELRYLICLEYTVDISVESHLYYRWLDEIFIQLPSFS